MSAFSGNGKVRMLIVVLGFYFVALVFCVGILKSIVAPIATTTTTIGKLTDGMHRPNP